MYRDALTILLRSLDSMRNTGFGDDDVRTWRPNVLAALLDAGILRKAENARSVVCDGCGEGCIEDVEILDGQDAVPPRAYIYCPHREDMGRVPVPLERLRTWVPFPSGLAAWLAGELGAPTPVRPIIDGRLWWLGGPTVNRRRADIFFARGATWPDAYTLFEQAGRIQECSLPFVLVPSDVPIDYPFGNSAKVVSLTRLLSLADGTLKLDLAEIERVVGKSRSRRTQDVVSFPTPAGTRWEQVIIELVTDEAVKITAGSETEHKTYEDMGFRDRRTTAEKPDVLWTLLRILAEKQGHISWDDSATVDAQITEKHISDLRKRLRFYFGISDDPFHPYRRKRAYETRFIIRDSRQSSR